MAQHKITVLDGHALNPGDLSYSVLEEFGSVRVFDRTIPEQVIERIGDSDIVFLNKVNITKEIISQCHNLKYIGVQATGYNVVDVKAAKEADIVVTNIPAYSTNAVAQHVFSFILHFTNRVAEHSADVMAGGWTRASDFCYWLSPLTELDGKTIGIIGYGNIGSRVAKIAKAFGMNVVTANKSERATADGVKAVGILGLSQCDFISLHCPLTAENTHFFNAGIIEQICNKNTILINTARGGLIDEKAVSDALKSGSLGGYAADVVETEPMQADNPLLTAPNCILTPHIAWAQKETRERCLSIAVDNLRSYINGKPKNMVYPA